MNPLNSLCLLKKKKKKPVCLSVSPFLSSCFCLSVCLTLSLPLSLSCWVSGYTHVTEPVTYSHAFSYYSFSSSASLNKQGSENWVTYPLSLSLLVLWQFTLPACPTNGHPISATPPTPSPPLSLPAIKAAAAPTGQHHCSTAVALRVRLTRTQALVPAEKRGENKFEWEGLQLDTVEPEQFFFCP